MKKFAIFAFIGMLCFMSCEEQEIKPTNDKNYCCGGNPPDDPPPCDECD